MIAVAAVVLSGILFMALGTTSLLQGLGFLSQNVIVPQNPSAEAHITGTVDLHPTFPTPSGGNGTSKSSQPPPSSSSYPPPSSASTPTAPVQLTRQIPIIRPHDPNRTKRLLQATTRCPPSDH